MEILYAKSVPAGIHGKAWSGARKPNSKEKRRQVRFHDSGEAHRTPEIRNAGSTKISNIHRPACLRFTFLSAMLIVEDFLMTRETRPAGTLLCLGRAWSLGGAMKKLIYGTGIRDRSKSLKT
jgi:hypothetical protein